MIESLFDHLAREHALADVDAQRGIQGGICFALVDKAYAALDTPLCIHIRKRVFPGKVVKKRFYQTNYKK